VRRALLIWAILALLLSGSRAAGAASRQAGPEDRWQWLDNTYWYVPNENLLAIASSPSLPAPIPVSDQTVYHIEHYRAGYFWGITAVSHMKGQSSENTNPACLQLVGSVTPEGKVHLTFTPLSSSPSDSGDSTSQPTIGIGSMTPQRGKWTMENQMSTVAADNILLTHWAYMFQCKPGERCFVRLPGVGTSIPSFLGPCVAGPPG
jgi:hypothetical protein